MLKMFAKFAIVGLSGVGINMAVFTLLIFLGVNHMVAAAVSFLVAVTNNFYWNFIWTFKNRAKDKSTRRKYIQFFIISFVNFLIGLIILQLMMTYTFGSPGTRTLFAAYDAPTYEKISKILSQLTAIGVSSMINFIGNYKITFRRTKAK